MREGNPKDVKTEKFDPLQKGIDIFEPSSDTKKLLYGTRKRRQLLGGILFPGLFSSANVEGDKRWVLFALFLELSGLIALCYVLWDQTTLSVTAVAGIGLVVMLFDLVFAWTHHFFYIPAKCEIENEKLRILPDWRPNEKDLPYGNYEQIKRLQMPLWRKMIMYLAGIGIVMIGICKALAFTMHLPQFWSEQVKTIVLLPCLLSYFIVAYIHLTKTGYLLAYIAYWLRKNKDQGIFNAGNRDNLSRKPHKKIINLKTFAEELKHPYLEKWKYLLNKDEESLRKEINGGLSTELGDYKRGGHKIKQLCQLSDDSFKKIREGGIPEVIVEKLERLKAVQYCEDEFINDVKKELRDDFAEFSAIILKNAKSPENYVLQIYGRLTDEELEALVKSQPEGLAKTCVALYGHILQLENLHSR